MKRLLLSFLFVLLVLANCVGVVHYQYTRKPINNSECKVIPVYIDKSFSEKDRIDIDDAIAAWNYALNNYIRLGVQETYFDMEPSILKNIIDHNNGIIFLKINSSSQIIPITKHGEVVDAFTDAIGGHFIYMIDDRLRYTPVRFVNAAKHETGHILGASHINNKPSLMNNPYVERYSMCIDEGTIIEVAKYYNLNPNLLNYCVYDN